jgi:hypothetical protein
MLAFAPRLRERLIKPMSMVPSLIWPLHPTGQVGLSLALRFDRYRLTSLILLLRSCPQPSSKCSCKALCRRPFASRRRTLWRRFCVVIPILPLDPPLRRLQLLMQAKILKRGLLRLRIWLSYLSAILNFSYGRRFLMRERWSLSAFAANDMQDLHCRCKEG